MPILGAHMSIAGGYAQAVRRAKTAGCDCLQLFTQNNTQWQARSIAPDESVQFQAALAETGLRHPIAHDSYLINLASPDDTLWRRSVAAFVDELRRAETLQIPFVVTHPGAYTTSGEDIGLHRVVEALDEVHREAVGLKVRCLLETTAGQGTSLGWRFEHLAAILSGVEHPDRLGVCFDTCHVLAAGYPMAARSEYRATMRRFDDLVGLDRIQAFHLNDSKRELGSRVDRHEHIGRGHLGLEPFRHLLADARFRDVPMYLETPKGTRDGEDLDVVNLRILRGLAGKQRKQERSHG